jgi:DNA-binding transcriptional MocR family regulator
MLAALAEFLPEARWVRPSAGFFIWVELPDGIDARQLLRSAASVERVAFVLGSEFQPYPEPDALCHTIRLSFSTRGPEEIREGIARLATAVRRTGVLTPEHA